MRVFKRVLVVTGAAIAGGVPGGAAIQAAGLPAWYWLLSTIGAALGVGLVPAAAGLLLLVASRNAADAGVKRSAILAGVAALLLSAVIIRAS